jgi:hypothetical protein
MLFDILLVLVAGVLGLQQTGAEQVWKSMSFHVTEHSQHEHKPHKHDPHMIEEHGSRRRRKKKIH